MKHVAQAIGVLSGVAVLLTFALSAHRHSAEAQSPPHVIVPVPVQVPQPDGPKLKKRLPRRFGDPAPDGTEPAIDFPQSMWFRNINSPRGGDGMCVFTSFEFCATYAGLHEFKGFRDWAANAYPGGGWPAKLAKLVAEYCKAKNIPLTRFDPTKHLIQYEGDDLGWIDICLHNGWMPGITLFHSPRYGPGTIYHMVNCPHLDEHWLGIQDNNFAPTEWIPRKEAPNRVMGRDPNTGKMQFWGFTAISPGPPPSPSN